MSELHHSQQEIDRMMDEGCPNDGPYPLNPDLLRGRIALIGENECDTVYIAYNNVRGNSPNDY